MWGAKLAGGRCVPAQALQRFERSISGFMEHPDALLHGVETRTSAPIRVDRDPITLESPSLAGLFPSGEVRAARVHACCWLLVLRVLRAALWGSSACRAQGAGYAGGIVSAAVDGVRVGQALLAALVPGSVLAAQT